MFRPSYDAKECFSIAFLKQKLDYMHKNPVCKKWSMVENYLDYIHSSARFYELNEKHEYCELKHIGELI